MVEPADTALKEKVCVELTVKGVVQGVGFRPFVYQLAGAYNLTGWVRNESDRVRLVIEGPPAKVEAFIRKLAADPPPLAVIAHMQRKKLPPGNHKEFVILPSKTRDRREPLIPPDIATCAECLHDISSPADRHYEYPFTNCTRCGPRFTIIADLPYDRDKTSMRVFPPCPSCRAEYEDPLDRRFHAQPVACPQCGPALAILNSAGKRLPVDNWRQFFWQELERGAIFAVKGLGGFHLACKLDESVISRLRTRKRRPYKPFAVMCRDLDAAGRYCYLTPPAAELLTSPAAPVVVLPVRRKDLLPANISPGLQTLGVMLPYTPLHHLLMQGPFDGIILTSGNRTNLPIIKDNDEAVDGLGRVADFFLVHDREIVQRCDDSVARIAAGKPQLLRRSRGYVPLPVNPGFSAETAVLGAGAEMKNTFCLLAGGQAILSQHLGEMDSLEAEECYRESLNHFLRFYRCRPDIIAYDPHPAYMISSLAKSLPAREYYAVQHHHAHFASCLAENRHCEEAIGVILDGTGYGLDGAVWGFEILSGGFSRFRREFHQSYVPLPGGEAAVLRPWRMSMSYLYHSLQEEGLSAGERLFKKRFPREFPLVCREIIRPQNAVPASSCGRLFDAVAALTGICLENTYEGQAAVQLAELLETRRRDLPLEAYDFLIDKETVDFSPIFPAILQDLARGTPVETIAARFHDTIVQALLAAVKQVAEKTGLRTVALSGGSWHNVYLLEKVVAGLTAADMTVLRHELVPPNDGGLSLGQAAIAYWRWKEKPSN